MATYIKTLKEDNGDITYPQTKASAVLLANNSDLETELAKYVTAEDIASTSAVTPIVTTAMIADDSITEAKIVDEAVTNAKIDWTTIPQGMSGYTQANYKGYFDIGNIRIQFMNLYKTGLNTAQYGYNVWWEDWPAPFGNNYYVAIANQTSDTGNVAGNDLKVVGRETGRVQINYNHVTAIGSGNVYWGVIGIGVKPS